MNKKDWQNDQTKQIKNKQNKINTHGIRKHSKHNP